MPVLGRTGRGSQGRRRGAYVLVLEPLALGSPGGEATPRGVSSSTTSPLSVLPMGSVPLELADQGDEDTDTKGGSDLPPVLVPPIMLGIRA